MAACQRPSDKLHKMKFTIRKLKGGECTVIEVQPTTTINEIKKQVSEKLKVPIERQKLLFNGKKLIDEKPVQCYHKLIDGIELTLKVRKPEKLQDLHNAAFKTFKQIGLTDSDARVRAKKFVRVIEEKFNNFTWAEIESLSADCMRPENRF